VSLITMVKGDELMGTSPWQGDLLSLAYLVVLVGASYVTFKIIEEPGRKWFKSLVRLHPHRTAIVETQLAVD